MNSEPNLLDYLRVLYARRILIVVLVVTATAASLILTLNTPKTYRATTTLLPSLENKEPGGLIDVGKISQLAGGIVSTPVTPTDLFVAMLKSRTMADALIDKFDLLKTYGTDSREIARGRLKEETRIAVSKEKVINITVETTSPQLAAELANYYTDYLDTLNSTLNVTAAKRNRLFIEQRLDETKATMAKLENALETFQTKHKTVSLEHQAKAAIDAAAELQAKLTAAEVQLQVMENYLSPNNPDVIKQRIEIREMERQLKRMEYGSKAVEKEYRNEDAASFQDGERLNPAFVKMPALGLDLARLTREVKVQDTLYTLLTSQYEQAKIQEARDTPTVQVLDKAIPPEHKSGPSIRGNLTRAFVGSAIVAVFLAFFLEYVIYLRKKQKTQGAKDA